VKEEAMFWRLVSYYAHPEGDSDGAGQGLVEYAIILALIAVVAMIAATQLGTGVSGVFTRIVGRLATIG
jgi:Flp pilus assembly pilin Flp